jgi:hypothetical protein
MHTRSRAHSRARLFVVAAFTWIALLGASTRALAQDVIHLKDGGRISGEVIELRPGKVVVIRKVTGEIEKIPWAKVDHVDSSPTASSGASAGSSASGSASASSERLAPRSADSTQSSPVSSLEPTVPMPTTKATSIPKTPPAKPVSPEADDAEVEITSKGTQVEIRRTTATFTANVGRTTVYGVARESLCTTPCTVHLPPGTIELNAVGPNVTGTTKTFVLQRGQNKIVASPGSLNLALIGGLLLAAGVGFEVGAALNGDDTSKRNAFFAAGIASIAVGSVSMYFGLSSLDLVDKNAALAPSRTGPRAFTLGGAFLVRSHPQIAKQRQSAHRQISRLVAQPFDQAGHTHRRERVCALLHRTQKIIPVREQHPRGRKCSHHTRGEAIGRRPASDAEQQQINLARRQRRLDEIRATEVKNALTRDVDLEREHRATTIRLGSQRDVIAVGDVSGKRHLAEQNVRVCTRYERQAKRTDLGNHVTSERLALDVAKL